MGFMTRHILVIIDKCLFVFLSDILEFYVLLLYLRTGAGGSPKAGRLGIGLIAKFWKSLPPDSRSNDALHD